MFTGRGVYATRPKRRKATGRRDRRGRHGNADCSARDRTEFDQADRKSPQCQNGSPRKVGKMSTTRTKQEEVDRNFNFFQKELPTLLTKHRGKFSLIRDCQITGFYDTVVDAQTAGTQLYQDGLFSIQKVTEEVGDLGFYSHAMHLGTA
jgi:hypothetical protein